MANYAEFILDKMDFYGYDKKDILWIGNLNFYVDIDDFFRAAASYNFDHNYGRPEIPMDLIIKTKDGAWFSFYEYDGLERVQFNQVPQAPQYRYEGELTFENFRHPEGWEPILAEATD